MTSSFRDMQDRAYAATTALQNLHAELTLAVSYMAPIVINSPAYNDAICQDAISDLLRNEVINYLETYSSERHVAYCQDPPDTDLGLTGFIL
jgi:hypothetical protein